MLKAKMNERLELYIAEKEGRVQEYAFKKEKERSRRHLDKYLKKIKN